MKIRSIALGFNLFSLAIAGSACQRQENANQAVERAIQEHLSKQPNLAMGNMVMEVQQVRITGDSAEAEVIFRTTADPSARMAYHYELRKEGNRWQVQAGRPGETDSAHPTTDDSAQPPLPEGHPPVEEPPPQP